MDIAASHQLQTTKYLLITKTSITIHMDITRKNKIAQKMRHKLEFEIFGFQIRYVR